MVQFSAPVKYKVGPTLVRRILWTINDVVPLLHGILDTSESL